MKRPFISIAIFMLLCSLVISPVLTAKANSAAQSWRVVSVQGNIISSSLHEQLFALQADQTITVIVRLKQKANLPHGEGLGRKEQLSRVIEALSFTAERTQGPIKKILEDHKGKGKVKQYTAFWIFNGFSVTATSDVINDLALQPDVLSITPDELDIVPASDPLALSNPEPNLSLVNAPSLWSMGYTGQGIVVASMDSGVSMAHADLSSRWRGGSNSWYDPYGQHPASPTDMSGHGTWTMGVMVGSDVSGSSIGVAPGAQWIAVKMFNDAGSSTATAIHQGYQWMLNPDGNSATADAPNIINNSWTFAYPGCYLDFEPDLQALRTAGILPIFAAGNGGPSANTSYSPANNPSAFAVGAINNNSGIYGLSSRGPSTCGGSTGVFPELVAPGVNINTTDLGGFYTTASGTSLSAPHVAGGLALLLSAYPNLAVSQQEDALRYSAVDLGVAGPDDIYGYGRLNLLAAYQWLAGAPVATATFLPTFTATVMPDTPTPLPTNTTIPASPTPLPTFTSIPATPTSTPPPTFTATSAPVASPTNPPASTFHIGDLDRSSVRTTSTTWKATVTIRVHNANEQPLSGVKVYVKWTNGATGTTSCTTNTSGVCSVTKSGLSNSIASVTLTITNATKSSFTYTASANHDPDGESNGTVIVVSKP